jgi:hypothetical protein
MVSCVDLNGIQEVASSILVSSTTDSPSRPAILNGPPARFPVNAPMSIREANFLPARATDLEV